MGSVEESKKWLIVSCTRVWGKECYLDILQCGMDLSLTDCYTWRRFQRTTVCAMQYYAHVQNKTENCNYYDKFILIHLLHPDSSWFYIIWILYSPCEIIWGMWHLSQEASRVCNDPRKTNWLVTTFSLDLTQLLKLEISIHIPMLYYTKDLDTQLLLAVAAAASCPLHESLVVTFVPKNNISESLLLRLLPYSVCRWHLPWLAVNGWNSLCSYYSSWVGP